MKNFFTISILLFAAGCSSSVQPSKQHFSSSRTIPHVHLPWKELGLTERQAAALMLDRFAFGAQPGDLDAVTAVGIDRWFMNQLGAHENDSLLDARLSSLSCVNMSNDEIA